MGSRLYSKVAYCIGTGVLQMIKGIKIHLFFNVFLLNGGIYVDLMLCGL
jgi:hypothetical protein